MNHAAKRLADDKANYFSMPAAVALTKAFDEFVREQRISHEKMADVLSRSVTWVDYERRHKELSDKITEVLPRAQFEQSQKDLMLWRDGVAATLSEAKGRATVIAATYGVGSAIVVGLIVGIILHFIK